MRRCSAQRLESLALGSSCTAMCMSVSCQKVVRQHSRVCTQNRCPVVARVEDKLRDRARKHLTRRATLLVVVERNCVCHQLLETCELVGDGSNADPDGMHRTVGGVLDHVDPERDHGHQLHVHRDQ